MLYGGYAIGAAVNLVLKKPSPDSVYDFSTGAGRWETDRGSFGAGGRLAGDRNGLFYNVIDVHIARLRRKVDANQPARLIHTIRGVGFMLKDGEP